MASVKRWEPIATDQQRPGGPLETVANSLTRYRRERGANSLLLSKWNHSTLKFPGRTFTLMFSRRENSKIAQRETLGTNRNTSAASRWAARNRR